MINTKIVEELFLSPICIENNYARALAMSAYYAYSGNKPFNTTQYVKSYTINASTGAKNQESTPGSVGLVVIDGPIVSASDPWYGIMGTIEAGQELLAFEADPNIIGTVLLVESGGGAVYAIKPLTDVLNSLQKPVVTFSKQILASAAYRIAANSDFIMMYHPHGIVGSLGTMYSSSDIQPMLEKWGMTFQEFYATDSKLKNKTYRDAKNGDGEALINNVLNPMNDVFLGDIKDLRGHKIDSSVPAIYQGETFLADPQGIKLGLIDGRGTLSDAIAKVVELANGDAQSSINATFKNQNNSMNLFNKFPKVIALKAAAGSAITAEMIQAANEELAAEGITGVVLCLVADQELGASAINENTEALTAINAVLGADNAKPNLTEALTAFADAAGSTESALVAMTADRNNWKAKAEEFGAKPAEEQTTGKKDGQEEVEHGQSATPTISQATSDLRAAKAQYGLKKKTAKNK